MCDIRVFLAALRATCSAAALALGLALVGCSSGGGDEQAAGSSPPPPADTTGPPQEAGNPPQSGAPVSALLVLGDSLSDVGNAAGAADYVLGQTIEPPSVGLCNPADVLVLSRGCDDVIYRKSRVSDGPVTVEQLAAELGLETLVASFHVVPSRPRTGTNYAVASAKARGSAAEDLARQVDVLLLDRAPLPTTALFVVMIGGNDAIDALQAVVKGGPSGASTSATIVTAAVTAIGDNLERLLDFGARRVVVANVPDLASLPAVRSTAAASANPAAVLAAATAISGSFNLELAARLEQIGSKRAWDSPQPPVIVRFDLRSALQAARDAVAARGANAIDACFDSDRYRDSSLGERVFHADCAPVSGGAPRFRDFVFWDGIHPTGATHAALGAALAAQVEAELRL